jgi:DNA-directed RNA polymerase subunit F
MIIERTPLNLNEVETILKDVPDNPKKEQIKEYLKKFLKTKDDQAEKIKNDLEKMDLVKIKTSIL